MGSAAAIIIGALIAAIGSGVSAGMQSSTQEKAMGESKRLADIQRGDILAQNAETKKLALGQMAQNERQYLMGLQAQKEEAGLARAERREAMSAERKKEVFGNALGLLNTNMALSEKQSKYWR